jgi:hypothetical protein
MYSLGASRDVALVSDQMQFLRLSHMGVIYLSGIVLF